MRTFLLGLILASLSFGAEVAGKWTGTANMASDGGEVRERPVFLLFKMDGGKLTGSGGPSEDEMLRFEQVTLDGDKLTFVVSDGDVRVEATLKVDGDSMIGEGKVERDGRKIVAKFDLKRAKG